MLYRALSAPISVQIELTTRCSNNCRHCYNFQRQDDEPHRTMSMTELRSVFKALDEAKVFAVTITGGEPLLEPDLVVEAIRLCRELRIDCGVNTNLTLLSEDLVLAMQAAGPFAVLTSVASHDERTHDAMMGRVGAFGLTLQGIELLRRHGVSFSANMVVAQLNAAHVYGTGRFVHRLGARSFSATKATPPVGCVDYSAVQPTHEQVADSLDSLLRVKEETAMPVDILECYPHCFLKDTERYAKFARRRCSAGITSAAVGPDGQVRPCSHSNRTYGSIFEEELGAIYARMTEWRTGELLPTKCLDCAHLARCSGGCRCEAEYAGDIRGADPYASRPDEVLPLPVRTRPDNEITLAAKVHVDNRVRFRDEDFGCVLWRGHSVAMVGKEAGFLLHALQESPMSLAEAERLSGSNTRDICSVLNGLLPKKMVRIT